ncbi:hypothetical protein FLAG1_11522 [Fusarium langsethiae]|uniref:Uncharacterized protein n=1 Tax=Fusarium langsethiae TaxID=179993 RepID=A0A0M9ELY1_FUSLA|nr:hypothetical protein FLAG1_11522 [Fusarium langsethiae]GKU09336.1 unnamed protein product [Fusarium langsethiae]
MAAAPGQEGSSLTPAMFLLAHPQVKVGRAALETFQTIHRSRDSFSIVNKPFPSMVLHQEFDSDTKERIYAVALVDDEQALNYYKQNYDEASDESKCDCAENHGPEHLIYDRMVEELADCKKHKGEPEPDPACSACWPVLHGGKCTFGNA